MNRCAFIIFAHNNVQTNEDVDDMIANISYFHDNCDFMVNHPTLTHPKVRVRHALGPLNQSNFIFGAFENLIRSLTVEEINSFDHFCLVSANQYFINKIEFEKNVNYLQFLNTYDWERSYRGKDSSKEIIGFPLQQPYGRWDFNDMYKVFNIEQPMSANWECATLTNKTMLLAKENIDTSVRIYENIDIINIFPGYMALLSGQRWEFPSHFGTYGPDNPAKNWIITTDQIVQKRDAGYFSIKRVNYNKDCALKQFIRENYMK